MNFQLRKYQQDFVDKGIKLLSQYKQILLCAATGSGKTKCFIYIADRAKKNGYTVLILTEASKIYNQLKDEITDSGNINAATKCQYIAENNIYIAMAQTLIRRENMLNQFMQIMNNGKLLLIVDEAHIGTPTKLIQKFIPKTLLIGFSATPDYRFAKHLPLLYQAILVGPQPDELVKNNYLTPLQHFARVAANLDELKIKNGDFSEQSQEIIFETKEVYDGIIEDLKKTEFKKAIVFTASIKDCIDTFNKLTNEGFNCIQIHSQIDDHKQVFDMATFKDESSQTNICISVAILTKGWDYPPIDLVILKRATTSLPLYLQMIGRGSRLHKDKKKFTVLDYGGNYKRHGLWDDDIDWHHKWNKITKKKDNVAPVKDCPKCQSIVPISAKICKFCGHEFAPDEKKLSIVETKLIEITKKCSDINGRFISTFNPIELANYAKYIKTLKENGNNDIKPAYYLRVAKALTQIHGKDYLLFFANEMGYKQGFVDRSMIEVEGEKINFYDKKIIIK